jgi:radical S-adenosyl methionine domain-containing protein 2
MPPIAPVSVNLVTTLACNYNCAFCFGHLHTLGSRPVDNRILEIPDILATAGCEKLTLEGGEPFLFRDIDVLLEAARDAGLVTSIVTNGSLVTHDSLLAVAGDLDWIGLSLDSGHEAVEEGLGRGSGNHVAQSLRVARWARELGIKLKVNTVVTVLNYDEDLRDIIRRMRPQRWKAFQVLHIAGENSISGSGLWVTDEQFRRFVEINSRPPSIGVDLVAEWARDMLGTYIMMLPDGRFFSNHGGEHVYGTKSVFDTTVEDALRDVGWDEDGFLGRGGLYDW